MFDLIFVIVSIVAICGRWLDVCIGIDTCVYGIEPRRLRPFKRVNIAWTPANMFKLLFLIVVLFVWVAWGFLLV